MVQLLLVEEGVLTRQLLIQLEVRVKLMPVGVARQGCPSTSAGVLEKVLLDLDVIIILDEVRYVCLMLSL